MVRLGEIDVVCEMFGDVTMVGELTPVVECNGIVLGDMQTAEKTTTKLPGF